MILYSLLALLLSLSFELLGLPVEASDPTPKFQTRKESWNVADTSSTLQLANSIDLVYGTLFQNLSFLDSMKLGGFKQEVWDQSLLFRRLYLVFALGVVEYRAMDGTVGQWPFPLASVLTQGQRILIVLEGVSAEEFLDFLTNNNPSLFYKRKFSSHGIRISKETGKLEEVKIRTLLRRFKKREIVLGLDFPFGGVGTALPDGGCVGPRGWEMKEGKFKKNKQIGHLHIYAYSFPTLNKVAILIGIEGCAPGTHNQLGCVHNLMSGMFNQTLNPSVSGGAKWAQLQVPVSPPAEYAGKSLHILRENFVLIRNKIEKILTSEEQAQKDLFRKILPEDGFSAAGILWTDGG